jgi:transposase
MGVDWQTVKDAEVRHIRGLLRKRDLRGIRELGIDEVAEATGHRYLTLVTDLARHRVIWVGEGRSRGTLKAFFRWFGAERTRCVRRFVIDMHDPYELEIRAQCRRARIIYDHFHLSKLLHKALDTLRRRLQAQLPPAGRRHLKGKRYLLLRARERLTSTQRVRLRELLRLNQPLNAAYILKEDFRAVFAYTTPKAARRAPRAAGVEGARAGKRNPGTDRIGPHAGPPSLRHPELLPASPYQRNGRGFQQRREDREEDGVWIS